MSEGVRRTTPSSGVADSRAFVLGIAGIVALARTWPMALHPYWLVGHPSGEAPNHFRMLWRAGRQLLGDSRALENLPTGLPIPLMDPVNLPAWLLGAAVHPALGYNLVLFSCLLLAFWGAWALSRELGAGGEGALLAGVAAASAPALAGAISFGITEALPVGWLGLHVAALLRAARGGSPLAWLLAGLCLAAFALSGWYNAVFGIVVELILVAGVLSRGGRRAGVGLLAQGGLALALVTPFFLRFYATRGFWAGRWQLPEGPPAGAELAWRHTPFWGTDLLNLLLPTLETVPVSKGVYVGLLTLVLAALAPRAARPLWAACAALWILALGHWLRIGGWDSGLSLPARWLSELAPPLVGLSHWHRAAIPASVLLAALAGLGADRLSRPIRLVFGLALLLDHLALSGVELPLRQVDPAPPKVYSVMRDDSGIVQLPFDNGDREFSEDRARLYDLWQPMHGHPIAESYEGPDALLRLSPLVARAEVLASASGRASAPLGGAPLADEALPGALAQLKTWEIGWIVLHRDRSHTPEPASEFLRHALGPPVAEAGQVEIYAVTR